MISTSGDWLNCRDPNHASRYRIFCFPHAGSSASFFRQWGKYFKDGELLSIAYPGRGARSEEPLPTDMITLASKISEVLLVFNDKPIVLFGHSLGAALALETARALEAKDVNISHLFASGSKNGALPIKEDIREVDDEAICKQLVSLGGTEATMINDPIFLELVLPAVRSDGKMFHDYEMEKRPNLKCKVTTICGDSDPHADVRPWNEVAPNGFVEHVVAGDHFYLIDNPPIDIISDVLSKDIREGCRAQTHI